MTTEDRNDHLPTFDYLAQQAAALPSLHPLFNRTDRPLEDLRRLAKDHFASAGALGIDARVRRVPNDPYSLARIFREPGTRDLDPARRQAIETALGLEDEQ